MPISVHANSQLRRPARAGPQPPAAYARVLTVGSNPARDSTDMSRHGEPHPAPRWCHSPLCFDRVNESASKSAHPSATIRFPILLLTLLVIGGCTGSPQVAEPEPFPSFPWPPPQASGTEVIPPSLLGPTDVVTLGNVDARITQALESNGYYETSYYAVPGGYAVVTRLERIERDGTPIEHSAYPLPYISSGDFSVAEYLRRLFLASPGFYRVIVFIVTRYPFSQSGEQVTLDIAESWLLDGFNRLPTEVAASHYTHEYATSALVYEFARPTDNDVPTLTRPGAVSARMHLERSGVWAALQP